MADIDAKGKRRMKPRVTVHTCADCRQQWAGRKKKALPKKCPRCQSFRWNEPKREAVSR
jgi:predicted Zn-ribbon and HTH transcriptional regulator